MEFAVSFFLIWALFAGVFTFGYGFYVYNRLQGAVANAAQLGSTLDYDSSNATAYTTALKNMVVYGDITAGTTPIVPGLTSSHVQVSMGTDASNVPRDVLVAVNNYSINVIFRRITLTGKPRAIARFTGRWLCSGC